MEYFRKIQSLVFPTRRTPTIQTNITKPTIAPLRQLLNLPCFLLFASTNVRWNHSAAIHRKWRQYHIHQYWQNCCLHQVDNHFFVDDDISLTRTADIRNQERLFFYFFDFNHQLKAALDDDDHIGLCMILLFVDSTRYWHVPISLHPSQHDQIIGNATLFNRVSSVILWNKLGHFGPDDNIHRNKDIQCQSTRKSPSFSTTFAHLGARKNFSPQLFEFCLSQVCYMSSVVVMEEDDVVFIHQSRSFFKIYSHSSSIKISYSYYVSIKNGRYQPFMPYYYYTLFLSLFYRCLLTSTHFE